MTEKRLKKILRRNAHRRVAQGIGAAAGVAVWAAAIAAYLIGENKLEQYRPKVEDLMALGKGEKEDI